MKERIIKFRVWHKRYDHHGIFVSNGALTFFTPAATADHIAKSLRGPETNVTRGGKHFYRVEIGTNRGWVEYPIEHSRDRTTVVERLLYAKDMHSVFYKDGESEKWL